MLSRVLSTHADRGQTGGFCLLIDLATKWFDGSAADVIAGIQNQPKCCRNVRQNLVFNHGLQAILCWFGFQPHILASLVGRDVAHPCALAHQRSPLALRARAHSVENLRFSPLSRSPAGKISAEIYARRVFRVLVYTYARNGQSPKTGRLSMGDCMGILA